MLFLCRGHFSDSDLCSFAALQPAGRVNGYLAMDYSRATNDHNQQVLFGYIRSHRRRRSLAAFLLFNRFFKNS
jgi:hypothetical protein